MPRPTSGTPDVGIPVRPDASTRYGARRGLVYDGEMCSIRVVMLCVVCLAGCKEKSTGARETFATKLSCPEDQVVVKPRPDLDPATEMAPNFATKPSDEVSAD